MARTEIRNWGKDVYAYADAVVVPRSVDEIVAVMKDHERYPSPVRAHGSNHSTTHCGVIDGGTLVKMSSLDRILHIGEDTVTAQAGALYIDVNLALEKLGKQLFVNLELGNLSLGSAATCGTKDASMPGEMGQVGSYAIAIKMVGPTGERLEFDERDPERLQIARSSYGLLGIVYEVTFRIQPLRPMTVYHEAYPLEEFVSRLPELKARDQSMMFYLFPHQDRVMVEFRHYHEGRHFSRRWIWKLRNWAWGTAAPFVAHLLSKYVPWPGLRYGIVDLLNSAIRCLIPLVLRGKDTSPSAQMIRYPAVSGRSKYVFSLWAFPEERYPELIRGYFQLCKDYYRKYGFRCDLADVGYRVAKDQSSLLSYSFDGTVMTLDPVATGAPGWDEFLRAYNAFCSEHGGVPLFNQTKWITPAQARTAFGTRLDRLRALLAQHDPEGRLLNDYFRERLAP